MNIFPRIEIQNLDSIDLGSISLSPLKPMGLGSGEVESLSSYLTRLSCEHWNSPTHLYSEILERHYKVRVAKIAGDSRLDSYTLSCARFVEALNALSPISTDFSDLTCLSWKDAFSRRGKGVLNGSLRWCVDCYREMRSESQPLHNRLLWMIAPVTVCPRHSARLSEMCPHCGKKQKFLTSESVVGYCHICGHELFSEKANVSYETNLSSEASWKARACLDLVRFTRGEERLAHETMHASVQRLIDLEFQGSRRRMARELNMSDNFFRGWLGRGQRANASIFIDFSYRIDHLPSALFNQTSPLELNRRRVKPKRPYQLRSRMSKILAKQVRQKLRKIISENDYPGRSAAIAEAVGISRSMLFDRFPDEAKEIVAREKERLANEKRERDQKRILRVQECAMDLVSMGVYPSNRKLLKIREIVSSDLRRRDVQIALGDIKQDFLSAMPKGERRSNLVKQIESCPRQSAYILASTSHMQQMSTAGT